jgi:hypothetical protein
VARGIPGALAASIAVNFTVDARSCARAAQGLPTRTILVAGIAFNLALLGYFYANFFMENVAALAGTAALAPRRILPIG